MPLQNYQTPSHASEIKKYVRHDDIMFYPVDISMLTLRTMLNKFE